MAKVTGIGGVFFKCRDPKALQAWYQEHLGFPAGEGDHPSAVFPFAPDVADDPQAYAVWGPFQETTDYFAPSDKPFMVNLRVDDLDGMLAHLKAKGVEPVGGPDDEPYGRFAWIVDPEGTKIELWEPPSGD